MAFGRELPSARSIGMNAFVRCLLGIAGLPATLDFKRAERRAGRWLLLRALGVLFLAVAAQPALAADGMTPLDLRQVKVGGEIGRHVDMTVSANLLTLDMDNVFLQPFRERNQPSGYIGLGKLIDATVRFAAYTADPRVLTLKNQLVTEAIKTQEPDRRQLRYFSPLEGKRVCFNRDTFCCPNLRKCEQNSSPRPDNSAGTGLVVKPLRRNSATRDCGAGIPPAPEMQARRLHHNRSTSECNRRPSLSDCRLRPDGSTVTPIHPAARHRVHDHQRAGGLRAA